MYNIVYLWISSLSTEVAIDNGQGFLGRFGGFRSGCILIKQECALIRVYTRGSVCMYLEPSAGERWEV